MRTRRGLFFGWLGMLLFSGTVVATRPPRDLSQIQLAHPVCSLLWSALLLGERIEMAPALAAVFVVGRVLVTSRTRVRVAYAVPEAP